jgi:hypothetical protein
MVTLSAIIGLLSGTPRTALEKGGASIVAPLWFVYRSSMQTDAYFAGLIDGEAYVGLKRKRANGVRPYIQINMTCEATLIAISNHFGVGTVRPKKVKEGSKPQWVWCAMYYNAVRIAERVLPFSITKRAELLSVVNYVPQSKGAGRKTASPSPPD